MRSIWKGSLSFGLVVIPIRLYSATESRELHLRYLHQADMGRIQYRKYCSVCEHEVQPDDIALGYEYEPGAYVPLSQEELDTLPAGPGHTVEIAAFVDASEIDPVYYHKAYHVEPGTGGERAYALLCEAMADAGRSALCRVVLRRKPALALVRRYGDENLLMETLHDPDEVRSIDGLDVPHNVTATPKERSLARALIEHLAVPFDPAAYPDPYRAALSQLIAAKIEGAQVVGPRAAEPAPVRDLMAALEASLEHPAPIH